MKDTNIELIEKARSYLEESQHEACFGALETFFKQIKIVPKSPIEQLYNELRLIKTRYHRLMQEKIKDTITYEQYDLTFNKISDALYALFNSFIDEIGRLSTTDIAKEGTILNNTVNIIVVIDGNFDSFSDEKAINIVNKIRNVLRLKEAQFRYLNIQEGSILIHVKAERNYGLLIKLKLLVESGTIANLVSIQSNEIVMDRLCIAMKNLKLNSLLQDYLVESETTKRELIIYFELAGKMANFGHWRIDIATNEMTWSDSVYKIFGFEPGRIKLSATDYLNYVYVEDRDVVKQAFSKAAKDDKLHKIEHRIRVGTSPIKYVENYFQFHIFDEANRKTLLLGVLRDITERKRLEEMLAEYKQYKPPSHIPDEIFEDIPPLFPDKITVDEGQYPKHPIKILFVEDHFLNQISTKRMLTMWSDFVSVDIADNGKIGVEKFEVNDYDIILMDLQMPVLNGFEALTRIRTINPDIPIIALSANTSKAEAEKCLAVGMNDYLAKPYNPEDLKGRIMDLIYKKKNK